MLNRRAICPSRMSEAAETPNTIRAAMVRPFQYSATIKGISSSRNRLMRLGMLQI